MKRLGYWLLAVSATGLIFPLGGCKSNSTEKQNDDGRNAAESATQPITPLDPATLGTISGTVHFSGKPPVPVKIDMSQDPVCSMTGGDNFAEQYAVHDGKVANVYLYLKSGPPAAMSAPAPKNVAASVMDQAGCKYVPHAIAIMRGESVEFTNSDSTMHNIHTLPTAEGSQPIDISQGAKGVPQAKQFNQAEAMIPVRCNNHPWMNAFVNVSATPFFALTGADGRFTIAGLPAGTYTLAAVHEKLGEQTITVTVAPKSVAKTDFTFKAQ
jgi:plastocyanin